ncbi:MAG: hypothetical protein IJR00_03160 [Lachnospiraceae bacterium]|nr:hypothetical protein [Lachnospiraceae bacterium]
MNKKGVSINFADWWAAYDPEKGRIRQILDRHYDVTVSDTPDFLFCSCFSDTFSKYPDAVRIYYTGENLIPDFNVYDYCIGYDRIDFGDRYLRMPDYLMDTCYEETLGPMRTKHDRAESAAQRVPFCGWVCSNGNAAEMRDRIFDTLCSYQPVVSGGRYRNNIGKPEGVEDKIEFLSGFKFALATENISYPGYTTEKIVDAFAAGCIPVYWGDPEVGKIFNTEAFVNLMDYASLDDALEEIRKIDTDEALRMKYLKAPALRETDHIERSFDALEAFLVHICDQPKEKAFRRPFSVWSSAHEKRLIEGRKAIAWNSHSRAGKIWHTIRGEKP